MLHDARRADATAEAVVGSSQALEPKHFIGPFSNINDRYLALLHPPPPTEACVHLARCVHPRRSANAC
eukprot:1616572-Prymnesium_polylepis.1